MKSAMRTSAIDQKQKSTGGKRLRIVVTNAEYAKLCRGSMKRISMNKSSKLDLLTFANWKSVKLPARRADEIVPTLFVSRLSDIPKESIEKTWKAADSKHLLFLEGMPVEAIASRLPRLNIRNQHRLHVAAECDPNSISELIYRLVRGTTLSEKPQPIVDAWVEDEQLVLLAPSFDRLALPLKKLARYIGTADDEIRGFEIDEDGGFLYWPHADVHLGWDQFLQIVDPTAALADQQKTQSFNQEYGAAIRSLREQEGLKQSDISGITDRHLRRVEHGQQSASKATLQALAKAHGMPLEDYLKSLAKQLNRSVGQGSP